MLLCRNLRLAFLVLVAALATSATFAQRKLPFNESTIDYSRDHARRQQGLVGALAFREGLLAADGQRLGELVERFRKQVAIPTGRPGLSRFRVTAQSFVDQLQSGARRDPPFEAFAGRWYGVWDGLLVDHVWHSVEPQQQLGEVAARVGLSSEVDCQFAWIGDGFGWNYAVRPANERGQVVLGYVYHVARDDPTNVRLQFPLVGYADGPGRLLWVTPSALFFEEALSAETDQPNRQDAAPERYAITGCIYRTVKGAAEPVGTPFQAVYTRQSATRPEWLRLPAF